MKTAKKLCQTMLSFILVCSMFFGTGITSVIAEEIDTTALETNLAEVKTLVEDFETSYEYQQSTSATDTINSIKDQLVIIENMITSGDLQELDEKNAYLEAIKLILTNVSEYTKGYDSLFVELFDEEKIESYYLALQDLEEADDLGYDNGEIHNYIQGRKDEALANSLDDLYNALCDLENLIIEAEAVGSIYEVMSGTEYEEYQSIYETLYSEYMLMELIAPEEMTNEEVLEAYKTITTVLVDFSAIFPDVGFGRVLENIEKITTNNSLKELVVNGLELDVKEMEHTVYVGNELEVVEVIATAEDSRAIVSITKPDVLVEGDNSVNVKVVSLNGEVKEYKVNVVKLAKAADQGDAEEVAPTVETMETVEEVKPSYTTNNKVEIEEEVKVETPEKEDKKEYDEEIEEESGLNGFTILLIVGGIALIGFGIYMLFGDKDDVTPKVKEVKKSEPVKKPEVKKQNKTNKKQNKSKNKNRK